MTANKKGFLRLLIFALITVTLFYGMSAVFHPKDGKDSSGYSRNVTTAYRAEEKNTIDVVFIGNSNAYRAFNPTQLWEEHKLTSCVVGGPMLNIDEVYFYLKDIYSRHSPRQVVLEANCLYFYLDTNDVKRIAAPPANAPYRAEIKAAVQPKPIKYDREFCRNLLGEWNDAVMSKIAYSASLMKYHARWQELGEYDFSHTEQRYYYISKGFLYSKKVAPFVSGDTYMGDSNDAPRKISAYNLFWFKKVSELCGKHGSVLSLAAVPSGTNWNYKRHNYISALAEEYSLDFTDYNIDGVLGAGMDWSRDTKDNGDHLNVYGATKVTADYGNILSERFGLTPTELTEEQKEHWNSDARRYHSEVEK